MARCAHRNETKGNMVVIYQKVVLALFGILISTACIFACNCGTDISPSVIPTIADDEGAVGAVYRHFHDCSSGSHGKATFAELWSSSYSFDSFPDYSYGWNVSTTFYCWSDEGNPAFEPLPQDDPMFSESEYSFIYTMNWKVSADLTQVTPSDDNAAQLEVELGCR